MSAKRIVIGAGRSLGEGSPTFVVAEIGQNHNGSLALAEQLVDAAAWAGADAVKFVKRDMDSELCREARTRRYATVHAFGETYGEHRRALELSLDDHAKLAERARNHGLVYFSTVCDVPSARLLLSLDMPLYKIASRDLANLPLVEFVAASGQPVILSTGMSAVAEIDAAVVVLNKSRCPFVLLQCTSLYPTPLAQVHLRSMATLAERYSALVGFSDHVPGILLPPVAVGLGAVVIEKHLTLDRGLKGTDHACSLEPGELQQMIANIRQVETALGRVDKPIADGVEQVRAKLGRSLVSRVPLIAGMQLQEPMLALKCPGDGLTWGERDRVVGRRLKRDVAADEKISVEDFV